MNPRTVKVRSSRGTVNEYVRVVEASLEAGKVKQRVVADLGREDLLVAVHAKLRTLLGGDPGDESADPADPQFLDASTWGQSLSSASCLSSWGPGMSSTNTSAGPKASRSQTAFVLVANRLIAPASEHGLAGWLETYFACDRKGRRVVPHWHQRRRVRIHRRQLDAWYRTLDQLHQAKDEIEVALYHRLCDLFSFRPELVPFDISSTYFEGRVHTISPSTATAATASRRTSR